VERYHCIQRLESHTKYPSKISNTCLQTPCRKGRLVSSRESSYCAVLIKTHHRQRPCTLLCSLENLGHFELRGQRSEQRRADLKALLVRQGVTIFRCTGRSHQPTHALLDAQAPHKEIMETELLETLSSPKICP